MITRRSLISALPLLVRGAGPIRTVRAGMPSPVPDNYGDTWVAAWGADGNLYSPSDDTKGFHNIASCNVAFNRVGGPDPFHLTGTTVNTMKDYGVSNQEGPDRCTWKSSGCTFLDGALYLVVARHKYGEKSGDARKRQTAENASILRSTDYGRTWIRPARENYDKPMFPGRRFATPYFIEYGRGPTPHGADRFVYAISNNGFWDNGDDIVLGRVRRDRIAALSGSDWEYYAGRGRWVRDSASAEPVLSNAGKLGMTGAAYLAARGRYLMVSWYYTAGGGKLPGASAETVWDFYEAPAPWGPWSRTGSQTFRPQGYYSPEICPKFQAGDRVYAFTAGDWNKPEFYRLTVVPLELTG